MAENFYNGKFWETEHQQETPKREIRQALLKLLGAREGESECLVAEFLSPAKMYTFSSIGDCSTGLGCRM